MRDNLNKIYAELSDSQRVTVGFGLIAKGDYQEFERFLSTVPYSPCQALPAEYRCGLKKVFANATLFGLIYLKLCWAQSHANHEACMSLLDETKSSDDADRYLEMTSQITLNLRALFKAGKEYCHQAGINFEDFIRITDIDPIDELIEPIEINNEFYLKMVEIFT
jgi:hypothetical protein